jgi:hypothetical protein
MIVQYGRVVLNNSNNRSNQSRTHNKGDTIAVVKVAARKSILMQITTKVKAANGFY